jgi:hypothetical protein
MITTIKEAHKKLAELEKDYQNFLRLQNYALALDLQGKHNNKSKDRNVYLDRLFLLKRITSEASLNTDIRTMATIGAQLCSAEMQRIQDIIDNTQIKI